MSDYTRTAMIACPTHEAFSALTRHIDLWWSKAFNGRADAVGATFTVHFDKTFKTMEVVELIPDAKVVWECVASHLDLETLARKAEWDGTRIEWTLQPTEAGTMLHVTHVGLNPDLGCFSACEQGWDHFLTNSLKPFLECGEGLPFTASPAPAAPEPAIAERV